MDAMAWLKDDHEAAWERGEPFNLDCPQDALAYVRAMAYEGAQAVADVRDSAVALYGQGAGPLSLEELREFLTAVSSAESHYLGVLLSSLALASRLKEDA